MDAFGGFAVFSHERRLGGVVKVSEERADGRGGQQYVLVRSADGDDAEQGANAVAEDERGFSPDAVGDESGGQRGGGGAMKPIIRRRPMKGMSKPMASR